MPEDESTVNPPERPVIPSVPPEGEPAPGSVPLGTPFAPEPGTETPFTGGGAEDEGATAGVPLSETPAGEPGAAIELPAGSPIDAAAGLPGDQSSRFNPPPPGPGPVSELSQPSDDDRLMAALAWISMVVFQLPLVSIVLLLAESNKNRPFQRYHATTSILFWLGSIVYEILAIFAYTVLGLVTLGCGFLCLWPILLVPHALALWYGFQAIQGRYSDVPGASQFARTQHWV